jgi:cell division protein FtsI/penicillin-binding protein 2
MDISSKTGRILHLFSLCLILFLIRVWYLSVIQYDYHVEQSKKPKQRVIIEKAPRATIEDRFGVPLAVNKIQYNATVSYANIREVPRFLWKTNGEGKRVRFAERSAYITRLSRLLGSVLDLDESRIEDLIHGKAALLPHTPFVIKEHISEEEYFRLRMLEKDWVGLHAERSSRRHYPHGKLASGILGYLGTMDKKKYLQIAYELKTLETYLVAKERGEKPFLPAGFHSIEEVEHRYKQLKEKAYTISDLIGKTGVEGYYEEDLRGVFGKQVYEVDRKGQIVQKLPQSSLAQSGKKLTLTISAELQDLAEKLLSSIEGSQSSATQLSERWMRGGAAIAMIPKTGEVVAMASYPRFDPSDFIPSRLSQVKKEKEHAVHQWLEDEEYLGAIWEGRRPVVREYFSFVKGKYIQESLPLTWSVYLKTVLQYTPDLASQMERIDTLGEAWKVQEGVLFDLCHLVAPRELFSEELQNVVGKWDVASHFQDTQIAMRWLASMKEEIQEIYHLSDFATWRKNNFKNFLKRKRAEEKKAKAFAKPYTDYLDKCERRLFQTFWDSHKAVFLYIALTKKIPLTKEAQKNLAPYIASLRSYESQESLSLKNKIEALSPPLAISYLKTLRAWSELKKPEKELASAFYPIYGYGFSRPQAYAQTSAQGSVFKLVTSYQILTERFNKGLDLNPLVIIDDLQGDQRSTNPKQILGWHIDGSPILRTYKGGRLPRSDHSKMGRIDLLGAIEQSSNIYFSIAASEQLEDPMSLAKAASAFNLGEKTGIDLNGEAKGTLPDDLATNKTGLYAFAIGQHKLTVTPLQTAVMVSTIANGGSVVKPHILKCKNKTEMVPVEVKRTIPFPSPILEYLFEGMRRAVMGPRGTARASIMRPLYDHPDAVSTYVEIHPDILVKTGTAQEFYNPSFVKTAKGVMKDHVWFAAIAYPKGELPRADEPELVVVVYLRFRHSGREGATIAGQLIKKWRELSENKRSLH